MSHLIQPQDLLVNIENKHMHGTYTSHAPQN